MFIIKLKVSHTSIASMPCCSVNQNMRRYLDDNDNKKKLIPTNPQKHVKQIFHDPSSQNAHKRPHTYSLGIAYPAFKYGQWHQI